MTEIEKIVLEIVKTHITFRIHDSKYMSLTKAIAKLIESEKQKAWNAAREEVVTDEEMIEDGVSVGFVWKEKYPSLTVFTLIDGGKHIK